MVGTVPVLILERRQRIRRRLRGLGFRDGMRHPEWLVQRLSLLGLGRGVLFLLKKPRTLFLDRDPVATAIVPDQHFNLSGFDSPPLGAGFFISCLRWNGARGRRRRGALPLSPVRFETSAWCSWPWPLVSLCRVCNVDILQSTVKDSRVQCDSDDATLRGNSMARDSSTKGFFRQMPNALLAPNFHARGVFGE